jgi:ribosomal protein S18 acetylase RimI-like enzyme
MEIYKLTPADWEKYKELRLEALQKDDQAFGSSYEESAEKTDEEWRKKLENPKSHIFVACDGENYVGMAAAYEEQGEKVEHIAYVWGVYVREDYRGQKIGKQLIQAVINELRLNGKIKKINLNVNTKQLPAVKMYESFGFQIAGTLHKELKIDEEYFDEHIMEMIF